MPRISAAPDTSGRIGQRRLVEPHGEPGGLRELVQRRRQTAAGRVAHPAELRAELEQRGGQLVHRRGVALERGLEPELAAGDEHGEAVVADRAGDEDAVARPRPRRARARRPARTSPTPAVVTNRPSALPRSTTFVSPATTATPAASAARAIERGDPAQVGDGEALLDDEAGREPERRRAGDGEVVDRAVDGELADVAAGEEERLDDVGVGREGEPRAAHLADGGVAELVEQRVRELLEEEALDERPRRLPARAVGERDRPRRYAAWRP